jgi:hypothetical protein
MPWPAPGVRVIAASVAQNPAAQEAERDVGRWLVVSIHEDIEVTTAVCLEHVIEEERLVATSVPTLDGWPLGEPPLELARLDLQLERPRVDIDRDDVACLDRGDRTTYRR